MLREDDTDDKLTPTGGTGMPDRKQTSNLRSDTSAGKAAVRGSFGFLPGNRILMLVLVLLFLGGCGMEPH